MLRKLRISTFGDLTGVSLRDFQRVSDNGTALFLEIGRLIQRARQGDFAASPVQHVRLKQASTHSRIPHAPVVQEGPPLIVADAFFVPTNIGHWRFSGLPASAALRRAVRRMNLFRLADLNGVTAKDFYRIGVNGSKLVLELNELIDAVRTGNPPTNTEAVCEPTYATAQSEQPSISAVETNLEAKPNCQAISTVLSPSVEQLDLIFIPEEIKDKLLSEFNISVRLWHILDFKRFHALGDLHGLTFSEFLSFRNCGRKTLEELRELVSMVSKACRPNQPTPNGTSMEAPVPPGCFLIPASLRNLNPFDLPLPARLEGIFKKEGIVRLGDLHGLSVRDFLNLGNCGRKTVAELIRLIERAAAGEFTFPDGQIVETRIFAELVDAYFARLKHSVRDAVVLRYGGTTSCLLTLEEVGGKLKVTRERVRQMCVFVFEKLFQGYGLKMRQLGAELTSISKVKERAIEWGDIAFQDHRYAYQEKFYCRVLKELFPDLHIASIKSWTARLVFSTFGEEIKPIEKKAEQRLGAYTITQAHQEYADKFHFVGVAEFSEILSQSGRLEVRAKNRESVIYPKALNRLRLIKDILDASPTTKSSRSIYRELKALHVAHGFKNFPGFRRIHALLTETPGIFYFGKNNFGLEKHLHVARQQWPLLVGEFEKHLRSTGKPTSTNEFLALNPIWDEKLTAQELTDIFRHVDSLTDLGRQLFALPEWRMSKRERIVEIIQNALISADKPLPEDDLIAEVMSKRSAFIQTFHGYLDKIPQLVCYGGGYYGLKPPTQEVFEYLFGQERFFEKLLRRRQPPVLIEQLWREFGFEPVAGVFEKALDASAIWKMVKLHVRPEGIELMHANWSTRRLLTGIVRNASQPMGRHEVEWELKERYAGIARKLDEKKLRELLKHDPLFVEDGDGNLICSDSLEKVIPCAEELSERAAEIVANLNRVIPAEEILDRLQAEGFETKELTSDILAVLLQRSPHVKEVGHGWFQPLTN